MEGQTKPPRIIRNVTETFWEENIEKGLKVSIPNNLSLSPLKIFTWSYKV